MANDRRRYALLKLKPQTDGVFLLVTEPETFKHDCEGVCDFDRHLFEEKICPHEFLPGTRRIIVGNESDPHHIFELVTVVEAGDSEDALAQLRAGGAVAQAGADEEEGR